MPVLSRPQPEGASIHKLLKDHNILSELKQQLQQQLQQHPHEQLFHQNDVQIHSFLLKRQTSVENGGPDMEGLKYVIAAVVVPFGLAMIAVIICVLKCRTKKKKSKDNFNNGDTNEKKALDEDDYFTATDLKKDQLGRSIKINTPGLSKRGKLNGTTNIEIKVITQDPQFFTQRKNMILRDIEESGTWAEELKHNNYFTNYIDLAERQDSLIATTARLNMAVAGESRDLRIVQPSSSIKKRLSHRMVIVNENADENAHGDEMVEIDLSEKNDGMDNKVGSGEGSHKSRKNGLFANHAKLANRDNGNANDVIMKKKESGKFSTGSSASQAIDEQFYTPDGSPNKSVSEQGAYTKPTEDIVNNRSMNEFSVGNQKQYSNTYDEIDAYEDADPKAAADSEDKSKKEEKETGKTKDTAHSFISKSTAPTTTYTATTATTAVTSVPSPLGRQMNVNGKQVMVIEDGDESDIAVTNLLYNDSVTIRKGNKPTTNLSDNFDNFNKIANKDNKNSSSNTNVKDPSKQSKRSDSMTQLQYELMQNKTKKLKRGQIQSQNQKYAFSNQPMSRDSFLDRNRSLLTRKNDSIINDSNVADSITKNELAKARKHGNVVNTHVQHVRYSTGDEDIERDADLDYESKRNEIVRVSVSLDTTTEQYYSSSNISEFSDGNNSNDNSKKNSISHLGSLREVEELDVIGEEQNNPNSGAVQSVQDVKDGERLVGGGDADISKESERAAEESKKPVRNFLVAGQRDSSQLFADLQKRLAWQKQQQQQQQQQQRKQQQQRQHSQDPQQKQHIDAQLADTINDINNFLKENGVYTSPVLIDTGNVVLGGLVITSNNTNPGTSSNNNNSRNFSADSLNKTLAASGSNFNVYLHSGKGNYSPAIYSATFAAATNTDLQEVDNQQQKKSKMKANSGVITRSASASSSSYDLARSPAVSSVEKMSPLFSRSPSVKSPAAAFSHNVPRQAQFSGPQLAAATSISDILARSGHAVPTTINEDNEYYHQTHDDEYSNCSSLAATPVLDASKSAHWQSSASPSIPKRSSKRWYPNMPPFQPHYAEGISGINAPVLSSKQSYKTMSSSTGGSGNSSVTDKKSKVSRQSSNIRNSRALGISLRPQLSLQEEARLTNRTPDQVVRDKFYDSEESYNHVFDDHDDGRYLGKKVRSPVFVSPYGNIV